MHTSCRVSTTLWKANSHVARVAGHLSPFQPGPYREIAFAGIKERSPVSELIVRNLSVGKMERLALQSAGVERHRFVVTVRKVPVEAHLFSTNLRAGRISDSIDINAAVPLMPHLEAERNPRR